MKALLHYIATLTIILSSTIANAKEISLPSEKELLSRELNQLFNLATEVSFDDIEAAKKVISIAIKKATISGKKSELIDCHRSLGYIYEDHSKYEDAIEEYFIALSIENQPTIQKTDIYNDIAIAYRKVGNYQKSKEFHIKTLEYAQSINHLEGTEYGYDGLGALYYIAGDYDKAADFYFKSLACSEKRNSPINQIITLKNLTEIYAAAKHSDLALQSIEKAYILAKMQSDNQVIITVLISYANALCEMSKFDDAIAKIKESFSLAGKDNALLGSTILANLSLGDIYFKQKNYDSAEQSFSLCLEHIDLLTDYNLAKLYIDLGDIDFIRKKINLAEKNYIEGLSIAQKIQMLPSIQKAHQGLYEVYKLKNNTTFALSHLELSNNLRDSLYSEEKTKRIAELQFRYDLERSEKEIQELKFNQNRVFWAGGLGLLSVTILLLAYFAFIKGQNNKSLLSKNQEIEQQNKRLEESNEVLRQFAYASAHDLKEPLRNIGSFVSLIQRRFGNQLPEECTEYMGYVTSGVKKMNNLLEDLLAYSTLIMNKEPEKEIVKLNEIVRDIKQNLQSTIEHKKAKIECSDNLMGLNMSRLHTTQLLQNLVSNGIKFVNGKTPIIQIVASEANNKVLITVEDNGIGIQKEYSEKVFHLFQRLHKNDSRYEGTGVGLAICKNIVDKYNGQIWFESIEDKGTKFFIQLPKVAA